MRITSNTMVWVALSVIVAAIPANFPRLVNNCYVGYCLSDVEGSSAVQPAIAGTQVTATPALLVEAADPTTKHTSTTISKIPVTPGAVVVNAALGDGWACPHFVCKDLINDCGQRYGGCYDQCLGEKVYTAPTCTGNDTETCANPRGC